MDEDKLKSIVQAEIHSATGSLLGSDGGGDLADRRREALEFYHSEPFGNEVEGRSQAIDSVVHDVIESALPNILEIFTSSDEVVKFEPSGPEDMEAADQATDFVNYIFHSDNPGFRILYNWVKDGLLQKNGIVKVFWEVTDATKRETFTGLLQDEVDLILGDKGIEPVEYLDNQDGTFDLTVMREHKKGRVRVVNVPPEEFLIARRAVTMEDAPFICHRVRKSVSELIEEGYDPEVLERIPSYDEAEYNEERLARFEADDEWPIDANEMDPVMRHIWIYECYLMTDYDGDGVAELRKITVAGPGYDLLDNEPYDEQPFQDWSPIPMPHKFFGMSLADETMDLQLIKSTLWRQGLDNTYLVNNARTAVNERVDLDDMLVNRPGGVVRVEGREPIGNAMEAMQTQPILQHILPMLDYADQLREQRTGITRYNQGLDADSLNKTATGISQIFTASMKRQQLFARVFAENGLKPLMKKILALVIKHQDEARVIRLRNEWVEIDPRPWNADMDVKINVGLGHGTKEQQLFAMQSWMAMQKEIAMAQGGMQGPLITWEHVAASGKKYLEAAGIKNTEAHLADPAEGEQQPQQPPPPDPKMVEVQQKGELEQAKMQQDAQKAEGDFRLQVEKSQAELEIKWAEMELKWAEMQAKQETEKEKLAVDGQRFDREGVNQERDFAIRGLEVEGGEARKNLEDLAATKEMAKDAAQALTQAVGELNKIGDRIDAMEDFLTAPKEITPVRDKSGKLVGGKVKQNGVTTNVTVN